MDMDEPMAVTASPDLTGGNKQRLFIIRHGERLDNVDYSWERTAERPYDPPLTAHGIEEAVTAARDRFRGKVGIDGGVEMLDRCVIVGPVLGKGSRFPSPILGQVSRFPSPILGNGSPVQYWKKVLGSPVQYPVAIC